jgi:transcriptional regulator with XRE-family HTH domain
MSYTNATPTARPSTGAHWASALARYTAARREQLGLTIAEAAQLSGLQISEWLGLEEGWAPEDLATLRAIAGTLRVRWTDYHMLAFLAGLGQKYC